MPLAVVVVVVVIAAARALAPRTTIISTRACVLLELERVPVCLPAPHTTQHTHHTTHHPNQLLTATVIAGVIVIVVAGFAATTYAQTADATERRSRGGRKGRGRVGLSAG